MVCPRCSRAVTDDDRFCGGCGSALTDSCRQCGRPLRPGTAFCTGCGQPRDEQPPSRPSTEDRRRVSVLFVDQVESTRYAEQADPELVRQLQSRFYQVARTVVHEHGGVVEKYIGDAVMALFGAPITTEADPLRCVRAGLELQRLLLDLAAEHGEELRYRVGIATGEALVDIAAARDGGQAIVAGDVVSTAARIEAIAPPGGVLVCGNTQAQTATTIRYEPHAATQLRGRSAQTELFLAVAPVQRRPDGGEPDATPLVEREHELGLLAGALQRTVTGQTAQLVTIFGQAGIGKSRLVRELRRRADRIAGTAVTWHVGNCPPFGQNVTYAGLTDIVKAQAGILDSDSPQTARQRLDRAVRQVAQGAEADRLIEALRPLVGLPGAGLPAEEAESAWRRFLIRLARHRPTVLAFEDLHWADESMRRFIELLAAAAREVPLLVLTTARPELVERDASWAGTITGSLTITLPPLRSDGMAALCRHMLGKAFFTAEALRPLVELADGNPLYAQEYVRMLVERGAVAATLLPGQTDTGLNNEQLPMPESVHGVIANRVDLLDPADRAVLQAAAVVGMQFWPGAVAAALGRAAGSVERSLRRLEQREFIIEQLESTMAGEGEFRFQHVLVRDVCYQRLPRTERIARHERTADWLETVWQRHDTDLAEVLAHHRWAGHEIARSLRMPVGRYALAARQALYRAAKHAYALHALDAAARHIARALSLTTDDPAGSAADADGLAAETERLRFELFAAEIDFYRDRHSFLAGDGANQLRILAERLNDLAEQGAPGEPAAEAARAYTLLAQEARMRADRHTGFEFLHRAIQLSEPLPDDATKVDLYIELGRLYMLSYEIEPAITAAESAAVIADRLGLAEAAASARITIATARYEAGDGGALQVLREITEQCRRDQMVTLRRALRNLSHLVREEGDWRASQALFAESLQLDGPGGYNALTDHSGEQMRAYFTGDLDRIRQITEVAAAGHWEDVDDVGVCLAALRLDATAADTVAATLQLARETGYQRSVWGALSAAALYRAMLGQLAEAAELLDELIEGWGAVPVMASGQWVNKAAVAAALTGRRPAAAFATRLRALRRTRWCEAALHTAEGALAPDDLAAGEAHLAAAEVLAEIPSVPDRMLALALAAAALRRADDEARLALLRTELLDFAQPKGTPGLLRVAGITPG
ncbi:adenylate/guanylate cyclase domain-containing protein [Natronosporangium hydrolyticum]|uniref:adenylate/guanylate cyclase domain-containing protein n=1 Tax=Natronosporangium hydrolyticum TaxID=2811111 RepID=UPI001EFA0F07|nr:adenylate/guanylate cyclase domain-containing protein [Natronosporangium hydrolyticum]